MLEIAKTDHLVWVVKYLENDNGLEWGTSNPMQIAKFKKKEVALGALEGVSQIEMVSKGARRN